MIHVTHPYGTKRKARVVEILGTVQVLVDENNEGHILAFGAGDRQAVEGDTGTLTFTQGGPTGGYWKFEKE